MGLGFVTLKAHVEGSQVFFKILRLVFEESVVELEDTRCVLAELNKIVDVFEEEALVEPCDEFVENELSHVDCHEVPIEDLALNILANAQVCVG